ncbi:Enoyl-CoA hydratase domain-containing protein 2, mitochondrial, partial [Clarias magur]
MHRTDWFVWPSEAQKREERRAEARLAHGIQRLDEAKRYHLNTLTREQHALHRHLIALKTGNRRRGLNAVTSRPPNHDLSRPAVSYNKTRFPIIPPPPDRETNKHRSEKLRSICSLQARVQDFLSSVENRTDIATVPVSLPDLKPQPPKMLPSAPLNQENMEGDGDVQNKKHRARGREGQRSALETRRFFQRENDLMRELVSGLQHDTAVRVVIFRSLVPGVFCAGADLKERAQMSNSEAEQFVLGLRSLMNEIAALPMPTIAAVDGFALGGGLELALACDLRTAAYTAQMGLIETTRGLLPGAGGSQRLPRAVGFAMAKELIFTGRRVGGEQALHLGLVNRAVPQNQSGDAAHKAALNLAKEILPQAPFAVRMAKEAMNRGIEVDIASGMTIEGMCYAR